MLRHRWPTHDSCFCVRRLRSLISDIQCATSVLLISAILLLIFDFSNIGASNFIQHELFFAFPVSRFPLSSHPCFWPRVWIENQLCYYSYPDWNISRLCVYAVMCLCCCCLSLDIHIFLSRFPLSNQSSLIATKNITSSWHISAILLLMVIAYWNLSRLCVYVVVFHVLWSQKAKDRKSLFF